MVKLIYRDDIDEIDTSDAYFGKILKSGKNVLIPYINMGVSNHELNESKNLKHIDFCYFVAIDLIFLKINDNEVVNEVKHLYDSSKSIYLGGWDMLENQKIYDLEIQANNTFIQLVSNYKIDHKIWIPFKNPRFSINLEKNSVNDFIYNKHLPKNLINIFRQY